MNIDEKILKEKLKDFENAKLNDTDTKEVRKDASVIFENLEKIISFKNDFEKNSEFDSKNKLINSDEIEKYKNLIEDEKLWDVLKEDLGFEEPEYKNNSNYSLSLDDDDKRKINKEIKLLKKKINYSNFNYGPDPYRKVKKVTVDGQKLFSFWDSNRDKVKKLKKLLDEDRQSSSTPKRVEPPKMIKYKKIEQIDSLTFLYCNLLDFAKTKETQIKDLENRKTNETINKLLGFYKTEKQMLEKNFILIEKIYEVLEVKRRLREELVGELLKEKNNKSIVKASYVDLKIEQIKFGDENYPENLKKINNAPNCLFVIGN